MGTHTTTAMSLGVCLVIALSRSAHAFDPPRDPHVRALDRRFVDIVDADRRQSPTFRSLVDRLEEGEVVVYLQAATLASPLQGRLTFMSNVAGRRYVLLEVANWRSEG